MTLFAHFPSFLKPEIIPGLPIRWYGFMYLIAFGITFLIVRLQVRERKLQVESDIVVNLFFWGIVGLLVGSRVFAVTIYDSTGYYARNPLQIIIPFVRINGRIVYTGLQGMSYHGGFTGAIISIVIYCKVKKLDILDWGDMIIAGVPLGYTFGRIGNFINGELYGRITTVAWGIIFPGAQTFPARETWVQDFAERIGMDVSASEMVNFPRHPSQLYEAFFEGIFLWLILWLFVRKKRSFKGMVLASYVIGYGIVRFFIEYVREPDIGIGYPIRFVHVDNPVFQFTPWNFTTGQILCFLMIVGGLISMVVFRRIDVKRAEYLQREEQRKDKLRKLRKKKK